MPFGMLDRLDPRNHILDGSTDHHVNGQFWGGRACPDMPDNTLTWTVQKRLNQPRCRWGCGLGWAQGSMYYLGPRSPCEGAVIRGKDMHGHARWHCAISCAKTSEPIDLPFGLWTRVGRRKHKFIVFARWRQRALTGGHVSTTWWIRLNRTSVVAMRPLVSASEIFDILALYRLDYYYYYYKLLWPLVIFIIIISSSIVTPSCYGT